MAEHNDSGRGPLALGRLTSAEELEAIRDEWSELLRSSASNEPMLSPTWLIRWWQVYGPHNQRELCVGVFRRNGKLVGLAPLCRRKFRHASGLRITRLELLGSGEEEVDETCSEYIGIIAASGEEQAVANAFASALHQGELGAWDDLVLTAMSSEHVMAPLLARALGNATEYKVLGGAPFALLPDTWDEYLANLSSSRRALVRKSLRAWESWAKEPPVLRRVEREDELDRGIEMLAKLHAMRWQETGHAGAFDSPLFDEFHRLTMRDLLREGALWLCWLEVEGEPVAALYNIVWNRQVRFYQSGRITDVPKKVRPGLVIHACAIQEAIAAGYTHYDFLAGTTRYKMQLANNVRPLIQLSLTRPSLRARLRDLGSESVSLGRSLRNEWRTRFGSKSAS
jgi:CelD/BcsL family acetyltransferase involved in cellulose biosynthesis